MKDSDQRDKKIKIICQACGVTSDENRAWSIHCALHGGPVCTRCCLRCEFREEFSGVRRCTFKDPLQKAAEANARIRARFNEESARISAAYWQARREESKKHAIIRNKRKKTNENNQR